MIEKIVSNIEVFSLSEKEDIQSAVNAVMDGKITLLRAGSVFSFILNPNIAGLIDRFNILKERHNTQTMSVVCTYEKAKQIVDKKRVNEDFFRLSADFCSKVIVRIPMVDTVNPSFSYNTQDGTVQFLSFEKAHPIRNIFQEELAKRGCEVISITSGNLHGAPTIEDFESAKILAALFNMKSVFLGMPDLQTVVTDIPTDKGGHKGSYIILSFCNKNAIEVKRLANKSDREFTEKYLKELFTKFNFQTPLVYAL